MVAFGVSDEEEGRRALVQRSRVGRRPSPRVEGGAGSGVVGKDSEVPAKESEHKGHHANRWK